MASHNDIKVNWKTIAPSEDFVIPPNVDAVKFKQLFDQILSDINKAIGDVNETNSVSYDFDTDDFSPYFGLIGSSKLDKIAKHLLP